jgi:SAM-dependent methyltransferase
MRAKITTRTMYRSCRIAPHHFPDVEKFVRECARVAKPGGTVGIVDQIAPFERDPARYLNAFERLRDPSHVWEYSQADWEWFYEAAGLTRTHAEVCQNRLEFGWWVRMQNVPAARVTRLEAMLRQSPKAVAEWLQPELVPVGTPGAMYFSLWQLILIGKK